MCDCGGAAAAAVKRKEGRREGVSEGTDRGVTVGRGKGGEGSGGWGLGNQATEGMERFRWVSGVTRLEDKYTLSLY